ncbi:MAG: Uma2 family endonuclease [Chloroflexi bacterium]|nr:Uma2 family endonuclease [Chloroflexota bacterium]
MIAETRQMTVEEYLAFDEASDIRNEYIDGIVYPIPGSSGNNSMITANTIGALANGLNVENCIVLASRMRVRINPFKYVYPDASVVCGEPEFEDDSEVTLLNPTVVVEVASPSSMTHDHISKVEYYANVPSIQGYLILDQERVFAEWYTRMESGWHLQQFSDADAEIALDPLGCTLQLAQVYRGVKLAS